MKRGVPVKWTSSCGRYTVHLTTGLVDKLRSLARRHHPLETGSSLFGYYTADGFDAYLEGTAPIPPDSQSSRTSFKRGVEGLEEFFATLNEDSEGSRYYVGEWHTHPEGDARPSPKDDKNQAEISTDDETACPESILLLLGGDFHSETELGVFVYSRSAGKLCLVPAEDV